MKKIKSVHIKSDDKFDSLTEYDRNDNVIYSLSALAEYWYEYDENNNEIFVKTNTGYRRETQYNSSGQRIYIGDSRGEKIFYTYDKDGNLIYTEVNHGRKEWRGYNDKGQLISLQDTQGRHEQYRYDEQGNQIQCYNPNGIIWEKEYDELGNLIRVQHKNSLHDFVREYNSQNKVIRTTYSHGLIVLYEYDNQGRLICEKSDKYTKFLKYNENGDIGIIEYSNGDKDIYTYEYYED